MTGNVNELIKDFILEVTTFLNTTLNSEILSATALTHKESILLKLNHLCQEVDFLRPSSEGIEAQHDNSKSPKLERQPSSPSSYLDMQQVFGPSRPSIPSPEYIYSDPLNDDGSERDKSDDYESAQSQSERSIAESDDHTDEGSTSSYGAVPAYELTKSEKNGYLEKKGKERLGGLISPFQKRWCAIKDGILYYYEKQSDKRQKGQIFLTNYEARPVANATKDASKKDACFEIVCPGKRTYQFIAFNAKDMKQWISAIERNSKIMSLPELTTESSQDVQMSDSSADERSSSKLTHRDLQSQLSNNSEADREIIYYETVKTVKGELEPEPLYDDGKADMEDIYMDPDAVVEVENPEDWYMGLWDCRAGALDELSFIRGDMIRIINKDFDEYAWWVGEKNGKVGFVPKVYLMSAYETVEE